MGRTGDGWLTVTFACWTGTPVRAGGCRVRHEACFGKPTRPPPRTLLRIAMSEATSPFDPEAYAAAMSALLALKLDPTWMPAITANLRVLAAAAELVNGGPPCDGLDAAPRFEA